MAKHSLVRDKVFTNPSPNTSPIWPVPSLQYEGYRLITGAGNVMISRFIKMSQMSKSNQIEKVGAYATCGNDRRTDPDEYVIGQTITRLALLFLDTWCGTASIKAPVLDRKREVSEKVA